MAEEEEGILGMKIAASVSQIFRDSVFSRIEELMLS